MPVAEFIDRLPKKHQPKVTQYIQLLEDYGPALDDPYSSQVEGKLRELKPDFGKVHYRILYYGDPSRAFVLLHGLRKSTKKLPREDVKIATRRMAGDLALK